MLETGSLITIAWLGLVSILVTSAGGKLYYKASLGTALQKLGFRSAGLRQWVGAALAPVELLIALWLATGWLAQWSTLATFGLVALFNLVLWRLMHLGYDGGCGCFGGKSVGPVRVVHLVRNGLMLLASVLLLLNAWTGPGPTVAGSSGALWGVPGAQLQHAALVLAGLLVIYLLAGAAEKLLFRAYWT